MVENAVVENIKGTLKIIGDLKSKFGIKRNPDCKESLLYVGVANSDLMTQLNPVVEEYFGKPYKPEGETAFMKNWFDGFVKDVGGVRTEQTLFRKDINDRLTLYCAYWPWGTNPINTSVRIGLLCRTEEEEEEMVKLLKGCF